MGVNDLENGVRTPDPLGRRELITFYLQINYFYVTNPPIRVIYYNQKHIHQVAPFISLTLTLNAILSTILERTFSQPQCMSSYSFPAGTARFVASVAVAFGHAWQTLVHYIFTVVLAEGTDAERACPKRRL